MIRTVTPKGEFITRLQRDPVHLWQLNGGAGLYYNAMGCGAFSTAMSVSVYQPNAFANNGGYTVAHGIYDRMLKVPFSSGGTFESQNSVVLRSFGLQASMFLFGTFEPVAAAIDLGAPVIILINPIILNIGKHDVLAVGYSRDICGQPMSLYIDNPWIKESTQNVPDPATYPGNSKIAASELQSNWTGTFTPVFADKGSLNEWQQRTGRKWGIG